VIDRDPQAIAISTFIIQFTTTELNGVADPDAIFGPRATNELNWQAHDPGTLVTNLRGMHIALWTGDGNPGPLDPGPVDPAASSIETITFGATLLFDGYLNEIGIRHAYNYYGGGTHTFAYWARDLEEYVPSLMRRFRHSPARLRSIDFRSTDARWERWGWEVALQGAAPGFTDLADARRSGFVLTGTGRATVRTAALYRPGSRVQVITRGATRSVAERTVGSSGRLRVVVPLGEDTTAATTRVRIRHLAAR
jgi:hypothetical protein